MRYFFALIMSISVGITSSQAQESLLQEIPLPLPPASVWAKTWHHKGKMVEANTFRICSFTPVSFINNIPEPTDSAGLVTCYLNYGGLDGEPGRLLAQWGSQVTWQGKYRNDFFFSVGYQPYAYYSDGLALFLEYEPETKQAILHGVNATTGETFTYQLQQKIPSFYYLNQIDIIRQETGFIIAYYEPDQPTQSLANQTNIKTYEKPIIILEAIDQKGQAQYHKKLSATLDNGTKVITQIDEYTFLKTLKLWSIPNNHYAITIDSRATNAQAYIRPNKAYSFSPENGMRLIEQRYPLEKPELITFNKTSYNILVFAANGQLEQQSLISIQGEAADAAKEHLIDSQGNFLLLHYTGFTGTIKKLLPYQLQINRYDLLGKETGKRHIIAEPAPEDKGNGSGVCLPWNLIYLVEGVYVITCEQNSFFEDELVFSDDYYQLKAMVVDFSEREADELKIFDTTTAKVLYNRGTFYADFGKSLSWLRMATSPNDVLIFIITPTDSDFSPYISHKDWLFLSQGRDPWYSPHYDTSLHPRSRDFKCRPITLRFNEAINTHIFIPGNHVVIPKPSRTGR